jgi:hypothetical protein
VGTKNGNNLRTTSYTANNLNQYAARTTPCFAEVLGMANPLASLTINSSASGIYRRGEYCRRELSISNSGGPVRESVTVAASFGGQSDPPVTGGIFGIRHGKNFQAWTKSICWRLAGKDKIFWSPL